MEKFLDGMELTKKAALKYLNSEKKILQAQEQLKKIFNSKFLESGLELKIQNIPKMYYEAIKEAKNNKINSNVASLFFTLYLENYQQKLWKDCSAGQEAELFVASSPLLNPSYLFGNGKTENQVLYGNFGVSFNIRSLSDLAYINDFVPFSYMITHNHLPKAILFLGVGDNLAQVSQSCEKCNLVSSIRQTTHKCNNPAGIVFARARKYVEDVQAAKHYADLDAYKHVVLNAEGKEEFFKIPIIKAIYIKDENKLYTINNCKPDIELKVYLKSLSSFEEIIKVLEENEKNYLYPQLFKYIKTCQIGCVDARVRHNLVPFGLVKEIGSVLNKEQIKALTKNSFDYVISSSHNFCGYIKTLYEIHKSNKELKAIFKDKNPILRKILQASYKKILNGEVGVLFGRDETLAAIYELEKDNKFLSQQTKSLIISLISGSTNDIRKTVRHALFREKAYISSNGFFVFPAAKKLEEALDSFSLTLSKENFDFLLNEENARENLLKLSEAFRAKNKSKIKLPPLSAYLFDLKTGYKLVLEDSLPSSKEEFYTFSRKLFYDPSQEITFNFKPKKT
ncbi:MAG: hypothetical protein ACK4J0_00955 [Candidatus Anstonellaceae archaeon]